jgi:hypothetical protein
MAMERKLPERLASGELKVRGDGLLPQLKVTPAAGSREGR